MTSQDRTLDHYQELMTINATGHVLRVGRQLGVLTALSERQHTLGELSDRLGLRSDRLSELMAALRAIGIIERYQDDFALSSTARLLCQYDHDLGDTSWVELAEAIKCPSDSTEASDAIPQQRLNAIAATQWVHTPAAMQVAEILNTVESNEHKTLLDLACGSAVWSSAICYRDPKLRVTAIDHEDALTAAAATATSIQLNDRFQTRAASFIDYEPEEDSHDIALIAQTLHSLSPSQIDLILSRLTRTVRSGGRVVVIDSFAGPHAPTLAESLEPLRLAVEAPGASIPSITEAESRFKAVGIQSVAFTYIAASRIGLGMMVGTKS
ncbi:MAG: class I SAM-dependent methyltransferase [Planctomycetota bacterium]